MSDLLRVVAVLLIVLGNAFFVAAEYALVTARRSRLEALAERGILRARIAVRIMDSPVRFIGTVQLGITVFSILLGAVGEPLVEHFLDPVMATGVAFVLAFALVTYLHVTLGELVPKAIALAKNESTALWVALPVEGCYIVTYPLVWLLQSSSNAVTRLFGIQPAPAGVVTHTEEELRMIVAQAEDTGVIEEAEEEMLYKVFDFADKEASDVMVPRPEVVAVSVELPAQECLAAVIDSPYTRYPAYRGTLDEIVGVLHVRDLFSALYSDGMQNVAIADIVRPAYFVPETKDLGALLAEFRRTKQHMAIVLDEYGAMQGIVTLETCSRRSSARSPTSTTCRTSRCSGSTRAASASTARSRSTTSTSSSARSSRRRTTTRSPASSSASWAGRPRPATRCASTACASRSSRSTAPASSCSRSSSSGRGRPARRRPRRPGERPRDLSCGQVRLSAVERFATEWNEKHYAEVDAALLFLDSSTRRIDKAIALLRAEGAEEHLIEALERARDEDVATRRRLMQGTLFAVPKAQLSF